MTPVLHPLQWMQAEQQAQIDQQYASRVEVHEPPYTRLSMQAREPLSFRSAVQVRAQYHEHLHARQPIDQGGIQTVEQVHVEHIQPTEAVHVQVTPAHVHAAQVVPQYYQHSPQVQAVSAPALVSL